MEKVYIIVSKVLQLNINKKRLLKCRNKCGGITFYIHSIPGVIQESKLLDIYTHVINLIGCSKKYGTLKIMNLINKNQKKIISMIHSYIMYNQSKIKNIYIILIYGYNTIIYYDPQIQNIYLHKYDIPVKYYVSKYIQIYNDGQLTLTRLLVDDVINDFRKYEMTKPEFAFFKCLSTSEITSLFIDYESSRKIPRDIIYLILTYLSV
jgi:hypothetical protein